MPGPKMASQCPDEVLSGVEIERHGTKPSNDDDAMTALEILELRPCCFGRPLFCRAFVSRVRPSPQSSGCDSWGDREGLRCCGRKADTGTPLSFLDLRSRALVQKESWLRSVRESSIGDTGPIPDPFEMHWPDLDHMSGLFALEDAVAAPSCHARNVEKFCSIDHMVVCSGVSRQWPPSTGINVGKNQTYRLF